MKAIICGGGTGGHVYPAIAISEVIESAYKDSEIIFVGRSGGKENTAYENTKKELFLLDVSGISRSLSLKNLSSILKAVRAKAYSKKLLQWIKPDIVIGTGGYVCWPMLSSAIELKIPTLLHESNAYPGMVTRMLAHRCTGVMLNYEAALSYLPKANNTILTGTPLRRGFKLYTRESARRMLGIKDDEIMILSFGGSLGSSSINDAIIAMMEEFSKPREKIRHFHASGKNHYEEIKKKHPSLVRGEAGCKILPFIENMPLYMRACDLAITRSGAITLSELAASGVGAILVPSPNVSENHQLKNAKSLVDMGAAIMIEESALDSDRLIKEVKELINNKQLLYRLKRRIAKTINNNSSSLIESAIKTAIDTV